MPQIAGNKKSGKIVKVLPSGGGGGVPLQHPPHSRLHTTYTYYLHISKSCPGPPLKKVLDPPLDICKSLK